VRHAALLVAAVSLGCAGAQPEAPVREARPPAIAPRSEPRPVATDPRFTTETPSPATLETLLALTHLDRDTEMRRWSAEVEPLVGQSVNWQVRSWGGEITEAPEGYRTPDRRHGILRARVRMITLSIPEGGTLEDVDRAHTAVVACPAKENAEEGWMTFLHADGRAGGRDTEGPVRVRGRIWGARGEGGFPTLWLTDCEESPPTP